MVHKFIAARKNLTTATEFINFSMIESFMLPLTFIAH